MIPTIQVTVDTDGIDKLINSLEDELPKIVQIAARNVEKRAKGIVPVDTGATKNSIHVRTSQDGLSATIGPTTEYAPMIEFGTRFMPARPFMVPALEAERKRFISAVVQAMERLSNG